MNDNIIEIRDDEINVEKIMYEIRERVKKQKSGDHSTESVNASISIPSDAHDISSFQTPPYKSNTLNSMCDIRNNTYIISSHRKYLGKILVKGRQIVNGEVRRYVDPTLWKQSAFNEQVAHLCSLYEKRILDLEESLALQKKENLQKYQELQLGYLKLKEKESQIISEIANIQLEQSSNSKRISELNTVVEHNNVKLLSNISESVKDVITFFKSDKYPDLDTKLNVDGILYPDNMDYFAFEEHFRGSRTEIKTRQLRYIAFFEHSTNVLDIGCGRGEFLELLRDHKIPGVGIDINRDMVNYCKSKDFKAYQIDAIIYLRSLDDNHLDGIFSDQVIEHLTPDYLIRLVNLAYQKLKAEGYVVLGTVNILNPGGLANFFVDPTHVSPIHPEYLKYCLEIAGFRDIQILFRTYDDREKDPLDGNLKLVAADYIIVGKK